MATKLTIKQIRCGNVVGSKQLYVIYCANSINIVSNVPKLCICNQSTILPLQNMYGEQYGVDAFPPPNFPISGNLAFMG